MSSVPPKTYDDLIGCSIPDCDFCKKMAGWGEYFPEDEPKEFHPAEIQAFRKPLTNQQLRALLTPKYRLLNVFWAIRSGARVRWARFCLWRKKNTTAAANYRVLEFAAFLVLGAGLYLSCVVAFCEGWGR